MYMTGAHEIITWLESHGRQILIQDIPVGRRQKNRVILSYRNASGEQCTVGGPNLRMAVTKARIREAATPKGAI